jgi:hypothetical protein
LGPGQAHGRLIERAAQIVQRSVGESDPQAPVDATQDTQGVHLAPANQGPQSADERRSTHPSAIARQRRDGVPALGQVPVGARDALAQLSERFRLIEVEQRAADVEDDRVDVVPRGHGRMLMARTGFVGAGMRRGIQNRQR